MFQKTIKTEIFCEIDNIIANLIKLLKIYVVNHKCILILYLIFVWITPKNNTKRIRPNKFFLNIKHSYLLFTNFKLNIRLKNGNDVYILLHLPWFKNQFSIENCIFKQLFWLLATKKWFRWSALNALIFFIKVESFFRHII